MLPNTMTTADGLLYKKSLMKASEVREGDLTASFLPPGVEKKISLIKCTKALSLPSGKVEIAWDTLEGARVYELIYDSEDQLAIYRLVV